MANAWQSDIFSSKKRIGFLLENTIMTDVKFSFEGESSILHAHKLILASASPVFQQMFYGALAEKTETAIKIADFDYNTFSIMLRYIYTDAVNFETWEDAGKFYGVAQKYLLNAFKNHCLHFIYEKLDPTNVLKIYTFAKFYEEGALIDAALTIIRRKTMLVIKSSDFLEIDITLLVFIMGRNSLNASELELFNALDKLAENCMKNEKCLSEKFCQIRQAVLKINFLDMSAAQFSSGPAFSKLLSGRESAAILACLVQPSNIEARYPKYLSKNVGRLRQLPHVYFEVYAETSRLGRIVIELRADVVPKTIEEFLSLCNGTKDYGFEGAFFDNIKTTNSVCSVKALNFESQREIFHNIKHENFLLNLTTPGTVGLITLGKRSCVSWFYIVSSSNFQLQHNKSVLIGTVVEGMDVIKSIRSYATESGIPSEKIKIKDCGVVHPSEV